VFEHRRPWLQSALFLLILVVAPGPATASRVAPPGGVGGPSAVASAPQPTHLTANTITSPDTVGFVGEYTSLALDASGNPVVSYRDFTNHALKILRCGNPTCSAGNLFASPDNAGDVAIGTSLRLDASGNPVVAYGVLLPLGSTPIGTFRVLRCGNPTCTAGNSITAPDTASDDGDPSLALDASGNPVVSYVAQIASSPSAYALKVLHCGDPTCSTGNSIAFADTTGNVGGESSLALDATGNPVVAYRDSANQALKLLYCGNVRCTAANSIVVLDSAGNVGRNPSLRLDASGNPVVSYYDFTNQRLKVLHCGNLTCTSGNTSTSPDPTSANGRISSLALDASGNPVVSYAGYGSDGLRLLHCGNPTCTSGNTITTPDAASNVDAPSLQLDANSNPVVSYTYRLGTTDADLKLLHCGNPTCTTPANTIAKPATTDDVGLYTSLALDQNGYAAVSYYDQTFGNLKVLRCGNLACTAGNTIVAPATGGNIGLYTSLALDRSGYPVVSYYDQTNGKLKVLRCGDAFCTSLNKIATPDTTTLVGLYTSLALDANSNPVVSYKDFTNTTLKVLRCGKTTCLSGNYIATPDSTRDVGDFTSLALGRNGNAVVSYYDPTNGKLKVLHCGDANCKAGNSITTPDTASGVGQYTSLRLDRNDNPVISYYDAQNQHLKLLHCGDPFCGLGNSIVSLDTTRSAGRYNSLRLDGNGRPVVSYFDELGGGLRMVFCDDANCTRSNVYRTPDTASFVGLYTSLAIDGGGHPVVSYYDQANGDLKLLRCAYPTC
jgi:hypothetical protein